MRRQLDMTDGDYITDSYDWENKEYLDQEEVVKMASFNQPLVRLIQAGPDDVQFYLNFSFLHYRRAGNYHNRSNVYHGEKTQMLDQFIKEILK